MPKSEFIYFPDQYSTHTDRTYDGFLAFLPAEKSSRRHRSYQGEHFRWFEYKDTQLPIAYPIHITAAQNYLWLLINLRTGLMVELDSNLLIQTDNLLFYQTYTDSHRLNLKPGSNWFLLLGTNGEVLPSLIDEYPQLKSIQMDDAANNSSLVHGQMYLNAKLKRVLDSLSQIQYKPFSTYYQLANWNTRLFSTVFQGMKLEPPKDAVDHELQLYYRAVSYINRNFYDDQISIETIASTLHVSRSKLIRAFQNKPYTVMEQVMECRLQEAKELLLTTKKAIVTIAASLNFHCPKNFKRIFTNRFQISPLEYRNSLCIKKMF